MFSRLSEVKTMVLPSALEAGHHILVYKTFDVKLPEHKILPAFVEARHAPVLVNFSVWILGLRVIRAPILHVKKLVVEHQAVLPLSL
jgi:hypothetical protein